MAPDEISIERVLTPTPEHVAAIARILPQLSDTAPPSLSELERITANPATFLFFARYRGALIATLSLVTFATPTGVRAWIEDVVVDESCRGIGVAGSLIGRAADQAREVGAINVDLTSRPSRAEANRLYRRLGFVARKTNVYRLSL